MRDSFWVYMLLCTDGSYYTGVTNDADKRVGDHNQGIDPHCYTLRAGPCISSILPNSAT